VGVKEVLSSRRCGEIRDKEVDNMWKMQGMALATLVLMVIVVGCNKSGDPQQRSTTSGGSQPTASTSDETPAAVAKDDGPAAAVAQFLDAVRTGNDDAASRMLSKLARQKNAALNRGLTPPASDTATFTIGKVDYVEGGACVASTWTDYDADKQKKTDEAFWIVRHEDDGWRIAGVRAQMLPGEPYTMLNFEKPDEIVQTLKRLREEMRREMEKEEAKLQAQGSENQENPIRR
jgi:hypothetical protein